MGYSYGITMLVNPPKAKTHISSAGQKMTRDYKDRNPLKYWELYQMGLEALEISQMYETSKSTVHRAIKRIQSQYPIAERLERKVRTIRSLVREGRDFDLAFKTAFMDEEIDELKLAGYQAPRLMILLNQEHSTKGDHNSKGKKIKVTEAQVSDVYGRNVTNPTVVESADFATYYQNRGEVMGQAEFMMLQEMVRRIREERDGIKFKDLVDGFKEIHKAGQLARGMPTESKQTFHAEVTVNLDKFKDPKLVEYDCGVNPIEHHGGE